MIACSGCGKTIEKVPDWMRSVRVEFICNNCPNRQMKNIAFVSQEMDAAAKLAALEAARVVEAEAALKATEEAGAAEPAETPEAVVSGG